MVRVDPRYTQARATARLVDAEQSTNQVVRREHRQQTTGSARSPRAFGLFRLQPLQPARSRRIGMCRTFCGM